MQQKKISGTIVVVEDGTHSKEGIALVADGHTHYTYIFCDNWYDTSLNCRKRQLRPQKSCLLGNRRKCTFATL